MRLLACIWRAQGFFDDITTENIRHEFLMFFVKVTLIMSFSANCISLAFDFPWLTLPFLYSYFIPQIIKSITNPGRKNKDNCFVILISLSRLIPLWYFTLYPRNINIEVSNTICLTFTIYSTLQALIVILQNKYGGTFFLPKRFRPTSYDYYSAHVEPGTECSICMGPIEEGEETMVTPCQHAFHRECLERWMQERLECPMDRQPLPPLVV